MGLLELPAELQIAIAQWLPDPANLCAVHPWLYRVIQGLLYKDIRLTWLQAKPFPSIIMLLRTLVARPDLRQEVRGFRLDCDRICEVEWWDTEPESRLIDNTPDISQEALVAELQSLGFTGPDFVFASWRWANQVLLGNPDAVVAFIVALTPNIQVLGLSCSWGFSHRYLGFVFKSALCPSYQAAGTHKLPKYDQLIYVSLNPIFVQPLSACDSPQRDDLLALFYLPRIWMLHVPIANRLEMSWPDKHPPSPLSLQHLEIYRLREQFLGPILSVCSNLDSLHYWWFLHDAIDCPLGKAALDLDVMARAIVRHCGRTLNILYIHASTPQLLLGPRHAGGPQPQILGSLSALSELTAIEYMNLPAQFVYGIAGSPRPNGVRRIMPKSLCFFHVFSNLHCYDTLCWTYNQTHHLIDAEVTHDGLLKNWPRLEVVYVSIACPVQLTGLRAQTEHHPSDPLQLRYKGPGWCLYMKKKPDGEGYIIHLRDLKMLNFIPIGSGVTVEET